MGAADKSFDFPDGFSVSGVAVDIAEARRKISPAFQGLTVVLIDAMSLPTLNAVKQLLAERPDMKLVIMTDHAVGHYPKQCLRLGVVGLLSRENSLPQLLKGFKEISLGRKHVSRDITVAEQVGKSSGNILAQYYELSDREAEILDAVAAGDNIQTIADGLGLSPKTISTYRYRIFDKLMVDNDVQLTRLALKAGLVSI